MERLEEGLEKLKSTSAQVDDLKEKLAAQEVRLIYFAIKLVVRLSKLGNQTDYRLNHNFHYYTVHEICILYSDKVLHDYHREIMYVSILCKPSDRVEAKE